MTNLYQQYEYRNAEAGSTYSYLLPHIRRFVGEPSGSVLDLGCGNGAMARQLLAEGLDVYGVDASTSGIAMAESEAPGRFYVIDVSSGQLPAPLRSKRFDVVISTEVIEHLYEPRSLLNFAKSVMPCGGSLVLSTPYHGYLKNLVLAVTGKMDAHFTALWSGGHIKFFSRRTLQQLLEQQGFEMKKFAGAGRLPGLWKSMVVQAYLPPPNQS